MNKKYLILILLISTISCGVWQKVEPKQFVHPFGNGDVVGWTAVPNHGGNLVTTCNGQNIVGGYGKFSQGQVLQKQYVGLPYFEQIRINLTLYQIDSWDQSHQHGFDEFQIKINGVLVKDVIKTSGPNGGTPQCGAGWKDEIVQVSYQGNHSGTSFLLTFTDTLNQHSKDESWGIQNLDILIYVSCPRPKVKVGNLCLTKQQLQYCHYLLGLLDSSFKNNKSIDSFCKPLVIRGKQSYEVKIKYNKPFKLDPKCLTQTVHVEKVKLKQGNGLYNEWTFNPVTQTTKFRLRHSDLVKKFGCQFLVTKAQFIWICDIHIRIYLGGQLQLHYKFQLKVFLSRYNKNSLIVNVTHNLVVGECCENRLKIRTQMRFCRDIRCKQFLKSPLTVRRRARIYIIIIIITVEFKYYYLDLISIKLGSFIPVVEKRVRLRGIIIICLRSNIALKGLRLTVITRLSLKKRLRELGVEEEGVLRQLGEEGELRDLEEQPAPNPEVGDDYKLKNEDDIDIEDDGKDQDGNSQETTDNTALIAALSCVGAVSLLSIAGTTFYCLKMRKKGAQAQAEKYEQKESVSNEGEGGDMELATKC